MCKKTKYHRNFVQQYIYCVLIILCWEAQWHSGLNDIGPSSCNSRDRRFKPREAYRPIGFAQQPFNLGQVGYF